MGDGQDRSKPPKLPDDAPPGLREFVACRRMSVEIDTDDTSWLPMPKDVPGGAAPDVDLEPGADGRSGTVKVGWGFISIDFPVRVVDGALVVDDTADLPFGIGTEIDRWVRRLNEHLAANDKALDEFRVDGNTLTITKRAATPAASGAAATAAPVASTTAGTTTPTPDEKPPGKRSGCLGWLLGGVVALAAAVGIGVVATNDDDEAVSTPPVASDPADTTATSAATTTTTTAASTSTSTTVQVGLADDPTSESACASASPTELPVGEYVAVDDPCPDAVPATYDECTFGMLCATELGSPLLVVPGNPVTVHQTSPPDAVTGEQGPSYELHPFWLLAVAAVVAIGDEPSAAAADSVEVSADCSGTVVTGREPIVAGEPTVVAHPLFSYGPCTALTLDLLDEDGGVVTALPPSMLGDDGSWVVDATESPIEAPPIDLFTVSDPGVASSPPWAEWTWADDATTVANVLTTEPMPPGCSWFFPPDDVALVTQVLDGCSANGRYWVFAGGLTDVETTLEVEDTTIGHAGSYINPVGFEAPIDDIAAFATSDTLFDQTLFPCGAGFVGYTACPPGAGPMDAGGFVTVSIALAGEVPLDDDGGGRAHVVDFAPSGGAEYRAELDDDGWAVTGPDGTQARAIVRGNSVTIVVPADELPASGLAYVLRTEVGDAVVVQPPVPVVGFGRTPAVEAAAPTSTVAPTTSSSPTTVPGGVDEAEIIDFYAQLSAGLSSGDLTFPLERLHPFVTDAYPDQCPAALESFVDPDFAVDVVEFGGTEAWTWELPDGRTYDVDDAITVTVRVSGRGQTGEPAESHLATVDGELRWFTFCA